MHRLASYFALPPLRPSLRRQRQINWLSASRRPSSSSSSTQTTALATGTAGVNEVSDTITITADKAIYTTSKVPTCASTAGTVTAATTSDRILVLTVTGAIAAASTTFTCTTGDGALAVNPAAGAVAFTAVTTTDTTSATAASSYTTRAATAIGWGSATSYNQLTEGIAPIKHRFIFTPSSDGVLNAGTAGAADVADTITITASSAIFVTGKVPVCTVTGGGAATAATTSDSILVLTVTTAFAASTEQTIECATGDGAILAGTAAATITFGIVTTQDTTALNAQTGFVLRAATGATFTSAATSNQLVVGLTPTNLKFVINPTTALATGTAGVNEVSDTITITADKAIYITSKVPRARVPRAP